MNIKCFWIKPNGRTLIWLRRYNGADCPLGGIHDVSIFTDTEGSLDEKGYIGTNKEFNERFREMYAGQWATHCKCGFEFTEKDQEQIFERAEYEDAEGNIWTTDNAPAGAMWDCEYYHDITERVGPDGLSLMVKLPDGHPWNIDGRASNCDMPCKHCGIPYYQHPYWEPGKQHAYEDRTIHKCWVRHGTPPNIHVDKNGVTCGAGAGSIATKNYHGFLHNGELTQA